MLKRVSTSGWLSEVVWHSTEESRARGLVSVLACAEVAAAVATYWAIYFAFDTTLHLVVSLCIAPFVLLRSEASIAEGHRLWRLWSDTKPEERPSRRALAIAFLIAVGAAAGWGVTSAIDPDAHPLLLLTLSAFAGTTAAVALEVGAFRFGNVTGASNREKALLVFGPSLAAGMVIGPSRLWDASVLFAPITLVPALLLGLAVGSGFGALVAGLAVRLWSALRHLPSGVLALPGNWRRLMLVNDPYQPPELIPKIADVA